MTKDPHLIRHATHIQNKHILHGLILCCQTRPLPARSGKKWTAASQHHCAARSEKAGFAAAFRWNGADQKRVKAAGIHLKPLFRVKIVLSEVGNSWI